MWNKKLKLLEFTKRFDCLSHFITHLRCRFPSFVTINSSEVIGQRCSGNIRQLMNFIIKFPLWHHQKLQKFVSSEIRISNCHQFPFYFCSHLKYLILQSCKHEESRPSRITPIIILNIKEIQMQKMWTSHKFNNLWFFLSFVVTIIYSEIESQL